MSEQNKIIDKNKIDPFDCIKIIIMAICTNLIAEFLTWMLIYRTKKYRENKKQIDTLNLKIEKSKDSAKANDKREAKRIKQQEQELKLLSFDMMKTKMISMFIIGLFTFFFLSLFNGIFQGIVVAKLPFIPFNMIRKVSHRGILSNDLTDCSFTFFYILCNISFRPIIQKLLGFAPPRNTNQMPDFFNFDENKYKPMICPVSANC